MKVIYLLLIYILFAGGCGAQTNKTSTLKNIDQILSTEVLKASSFSLVISDPKLSETIYSNGGEKLLIPASIFKIIPTFIAINELGPIYKFTTEIGYIGKLHSESGILEGDLVILAGGDPTLGSKFFNGKNYTFLEEWVKQIKMLSITQISGSIIVIDTFATDEVVAPGWSWEDMSNYYASGVQGIAIGDNEFKCYFKTGKRGSQTEIIKIEPNIPNLQIENLVTASEVNEDRTYFYSSPLSNDFVARGTLPENRNSFEVRGAIPNTGLFLAYLLYNKLQESGIQVNDTYKFERTLPQSIFTSVYKHTSPNLSEIIYMTNQHSINLFADYLSANLAVRLSGKKASLSNGAEAIKSWLQENSYDVNGAYFTDGSGIARYTLISSQLIINILNNSTKTKYAADFKKSLAIAGETGTLKNLGKGTSIAGRVFAKSGSMRQVRSLAGFITTDSGRDLSFCMIFNNYTAEPSEIKNIQEKILLEMLKL